MCKKCGGACCKECGCVYKPSDLKKMSFTYLKEQLNKGKISISGQVAPITKNTWTYLPYLRARNIDSNIVDLIPTGKPCINLTNTGCILAEEERPAFGLSIKPTIIGGPCRNNSQDGFELWLEHSKVLEKLINYYTNKDMFNIIINELSKKIITIKYKQKNNIKLNSMEYMVFEWYYKIVTNKTYYEPEKVKRMILI
jgi:hypothetical protein